MIKEVKMFEDNKKIMNLNNTDEVIECIKNINGINIKKFMPEVRKIYKLMTSTSLWYGFSEKLMNEYKLKSKDEYAVIKNDYKNIKLWNPEDQSYTEKKFNFQVIPQARKYSQCICIDLEVVNNSINIKDIFKRNI